MIQLQFFSLLRLLLQQESLQLPHQEGDDVRQILQRAQRQLATPFLQKLLDEHGELHAGTIILVNRQNIHHLNQLQTRVSDGDILALFPPGAGG